MTTPFYVLDPRVGHDGCRLAARRQVLRCLDQNLARRLWFETQDEFPRQNAPAEIVDHRVQIGTGAVEQPDDGDINVPILVGAARPFALLGLRRVQAPPWPKPSAFAGHACPGRCCGKHLPDPLGMQGESANGHVAIVRRHDHVPHLTDLPASELRRRGSWAAGAIIARAILGEVVPSVVAGRGEAQYSQGDGERDSLLGVRQGGQDGSLGIPVGHTLEIEAEPGQADEQKGQTDDGKKKPDPALESEDFGLELLLVPGQDLGRDDRTGATAKPTRGGGTRNTDVVKETGVPTFAHEIAKSVVIGTTAGDGWHAAWSVMWRPRGKSLQCELRGCADEQHVLARQGARTTSGERRQSATALS